MFHCAVAGKTANNFISRTTSTLLALVGDVVETLGISTGLLYDIPIAWGDHCILGKVPCYII